jgi:hypothetical protein
VEAQVVARSLFVKGRPDHELGLFANTTLARDEEVFPLHRASHLTTDIRKWTMDRGVYLRSPSDLHTLIHHACIPTAYVDWERPCVRALREVQPEEEITLNYLTIYEVISDPIDCYCGAPSCYQNIAGFDALSIDQKLELELYLSPYLKSVLTRQALAAGAQAS